MDRYAHRSVLLYKHLACRESAICQLPLFIGMISRSRELLPVDFVNAANAFMNVFVMGICENPGKAIILN